MTAFAARARTRRSGAPRRQGTGLATMLLLGALALVALALAGPAAAATSCSTRGLTVGAGKGAAGVEVVSLKVQGIGCSTAAGVARQVAGDLASGRTISLEGVADMSISTVTPCGGCSSETQVSLGYPRASIRLSLRGAAKLSTGLGGGFPWQQFPAPTSPGGGSVTL